MDQIHSIKFSEGRPSGIEIVADDFDSALDQDALEAYWQKVAPAGHWKDAIDAVVAAEDVAGCLDAIRHFTATEATVTAVADGFRLVSVGYREGPAGP